MLETVKEICAVAGLLAALDVELVAVGSDLSIGAVSGGGDLGCGCLGWCEKSCFPSSYGAKTEECEEQYIVFVCHFHIF